MHEEMHVDFHVIYPLAYCCVILTKNWDVSTDASKTPLFQISGKFVLLIALELLHSDLLTDSEVYWHTF